MKKITIKWIDHDAMYKVSEPRWNGGDVYLCSEVDPIHEQNTAVIRAQKAKIEELEKLLRKAHDVLSNHTTFGTGDGDEDNNDDVISIRDEIERSGLMERVNK